MGPNVELVPAEDFSHLGSLFAILIHAYMRAPHVIACPLVPFQLCYYLALCAHEGEGEGEGTRVSMNGRPCHDAWTSKSTKKGEGEGGVRVEFVYYSH
jgi:hypothetical protein